MSSGFGLQNLLSALNEAVITNESNVNTNKKIWDRYAEEWNPNKKWVKKMATNIQQSNLNYLGDEWSSNNDVIQIINIFILPYIDMNSIVIEIGSGGARISSKMYVIIYL